MRWRQPLDQPPSAQRIHTPYDPEARYSAKRETTWLGYKAHLTESCDDDAPHLITHVLTTPATTPDFEAPAPIHTALAAKELLPAEHLMDAGYVDAGLLVDSQQQHQVTVIGPVPPDHCWQALTPDAYDVTQFQIDWDANASPVPKGTSVGNGRPPTTNWGRPSLTFVFHRLLARLAPCANNAPGHKLSHGT